MISATSTGILANSTEIDAENSPYSSTLFLQKASSRLKIAISLSPSCAFCTLDIHKMPLETTCPPLSTRVLGEDTAEENSDANSTQTHQHLLSNSSSTSGSKRKAPDEDGDNDQSRIDAEIVTTTNAGSAPIMSDDEIMKRISKAIPSVQDQSASLPIITSMIDSDGYLTKPIGSIVSSYTRKIKVPSTPTNSDSAEGLAASKTETEVETSFILALANGKSPGVNEYHQQVQKLSLFFIENADDVDLTNGESGGGWNVLYLFRRHGGPISTSAIRDNANDGEGKGYRYSFAGFLTLFTFYSPFRKPQSGNILRICQALVLPPYQRQGHGKAMMRAVYDYAKVSYNDALRSVHMSTVKDQGYHGDNDTNSNDGRSISQEIVEVNVEDPAPGFTCMRNIIDYQSFATMVANLTVSDNSTSSSDIDPAIEDIIMKKGYCKDDCFQSMAENDAVILASKLRITKTQLQISYEIFKLASMTRALEGRDYTTKEKQAIETKFRLMVKKRLNGLHKEDIGACPSKVEKQKMLTKLFDASLKMYKYLLRI